MRERQMKKIVALLLLLLVAAAGGCDTPMDVLRAHYDRFHSLCDQGRYVEAAFVYEYGSNLYAYTSERAASRQHVGGEMPAEPLLEPLARPERIQDLVDLERWSIYLPRLRPTVHPLLAQMLGQPASSTREHLLDYHTKNGPRLHWDAAKGSFVLGPARPAGRLPKGFQALASAGTSQDGHPLRVRCLADGSEMAYVPPLKTWRAYTDDEGKGIETPAFYMDIHEVTNRQYAQFCRKTGRKMPEYIRYWKGGKKELKGFDEPSLPVTCVRWEDAMAYAQWAGKTLPTTDEWMHAALGDGKRRFPWGDMQPEPARREGFAVFGRKYPENGGKPASVGGRGAGASPFGIQDLLGNVAEWVSDRGSPGRYEMVGYPYMHRWPQPEDMRWPEDQTSDRPGLPSQTPWIGFRCVLLLASQ